MILWLICLIWGHKTSYLAESMGVATDLQLIKTGDLRNSQGVVDVNISLLPPGMSLHDAIYFWSLGYTWKQSDFCIRCGKWKSDAGPKSSIDAPQVLLDSRVFQTN